MTTATAPVRVAPGTVRIRPDQKWCWDSSYLWRKGPWDDDGNGFWMIERLGRDPWAVHIVIDDAAPERNHAELSNLLTDATKAEALEAQDDFLRSLSIAAAMPPADLVKLRNAVTSGRVGGAADGKPRCRARKAAGK